MELLFRFLYPYMLYILLPFIAALIFVRLHYKRQARYRYSLASELKRNGLGLRQHPYQKVFFALRFIILLTLAFLIARPQLVDQRSSVKVEGLNIMLVLDISGSMHYQGGDGIKSRLDIAKEEAIRFVEKRENDAIGLVLFANDVISRCPLTLDKKILINIINEVNVGLLDYQGTLLARGLVTALNRFRKLKSADKSNIIIILTDGSSEGNDIDPEIAIRAAKQLGVKIYTIGIGDEQILVPTPSGLIPYEFINKKLLQHIADQTGGKFFLSNNQQETREVYDTIDRLEKVEQDLPLFTNVQEVFMPFLWLIVLLLVIEVLFSSLIWFGI